MIIWHRVPYCAALRSFKLGKLGSFLPTTCAASLPISRARAPASWEGLSQLPLIFRAPSRCDTQLQVGNGLNVSRLHNLILSSNHKDLPTFSSCGGETHPYRVGRRTPSVAAGVSSSLCPVREGPACLPSVSSKR